MLRKGVWNALVAFSLVILLISTTVGCSQSSATTQASKPPAASSQAPATSAQSTQAPPAATQSTQATTTSSTVSAAGPEVNWKFNTTVPNQHYQYLALQWVADQVSQQTGGKFKITVYPQGALPFTQEQALADVEKGNVEGYHMLGASVAGTDQTFDMLSLPGVYPAALAAKRSVCDYIYPDYKKAVESKHNVILFSIMIQQSRNLYSKKPAKTLADLKGMKIRSAGGMEADFTNKLGASSTSLNANELYTALQTGTIDGYWLVDTGTLQWKLNEVVKNIANISSGESGNFFLINKTAFDKLPANYQKVLMDLQPAYQKKLGDSMIEQMAASRKILLDAGMVQYDWAPADLKPLQALYQPYADAWLAKVTPDVKALYDKTTAFVQKQ